MAPYVVDAGDRLWFSRCRRSWDWSALARQALEPAGNRVAQAEPGRGLRDALAVHYFPGMWSWDRAIVAPLVVAAFERAGGSNDVRPVLDAFQQWAPESDQFTPVRVEADLEVHVPDPDHPDQHLATAGGAAVRYRDRVALLMVDDGDRHWIGDHRVVTRFTPADLLALDPRTATACWAWEEMELGAPIVGTQYTEIRLDPPEFRRTAVERSTQDKQRAATRLGRAVRDMLDPALTIDATPDWSHCSECGFRCPCLAMERGEDVSALLTAGYQARSADVIEEGRLGGVSWGLGRGAAPPRFDKH